MTSRLNVSIHGHRSRASWLYVGHSKGNSRLGSTCSSETTSSSSRSSEASTLSDSKLSKLSEEERRSSGVTLGLGWWTASGLMYICTLSAMVVLPGADIMHAGSVGARELQGQATGEVDALERACGVYYVCVCGQSSSIDGRRLIHEEPGAEKEELQKELRFPSRIPGPRHSGSAV